MGAAAAIAVAVVTVHGLGLQPDSTAYVRTGLLAASDLGEALRPPLDPIAGSLQHFPPLFGLMLGAIQFLTDDLAGGARWVQIGLAFTNVLLFARLVGRHASRRLVRLAACVLAVSAGFILTLHGALLSDGTFLTLCLACLLTLERMSDTGSARRLVMTAALSGAFAGAAILTRFLGVSLVATILVVIWRERSLLWARLTASVFATVLALAPVAAWTATSGSPSRLPDWHPPIGRLRDLPPTFAGWLVPDTLLSTGVGAVAVVLAATAGLLSLVHGGPRADRRTRSDADEVNPGRASVLVVFAICYSVTLVLAMTLVDRFTQFNQRIVFPAWMATMGAVAAHWRPRSSLLPAITIWVSVMCANTAVEVWNARDGQDWNDAALRSSPTLAFVVEQPTTKRIYSDAADVVFLLSGREVIRLPALDTSPSNRQEAIRSFGDTVRSEASVVVMFDRITRPHFPSVEELERIAGLGVTRRLVDGTVLTAAAVGEDG